MLPRRLQRLAVAGATAALAGALLAPAASGVAPGANGRIAVSSYSSGTPERWVEQYEPFSGLPFVPVSNSFSTGGDALAGDEHPSWSPDGRLVLSGEPDGDRLVGDDRGPDLIVTDALGTVRTNITRTPDVFELEPAWSPDGAAIAYVVFEVPPGAEFGEPAIWLIGAGGAGARRLGPGRWPAWSPDGRRIAYARDGEIFTMARDGSDVRRLTWDPGEDLSPTWSPDGASIAWGTRDPVENHLTREDIWIARADGSSPRQLTSDPLAEGEPAFSPDGTMLAFGRHAPGECCFQIRALTLATGEERHLGGRGTADWERLNRPPVAGIRVVPGRPRRGGTVLLRSTSADPDGPLASQAWDLDGDGAHDDATGDRARRRVGRREGSFTVGLRVTDADGAVAVTSEVIRVDRR